MASTEASFAPLSSLTKETTGDVVDVSSGEILDTTDQLHDNKYETTKKELWAYYWCVVLTESLSTCCEEPKSLV